MADKEKKTAVTTITVDAELKAQFTEICEELGMSFSGAIQIFMRQVVRDKRLPFTPDLNSRTDSYEKSKNAEMEKRLMAYLSAIHDIK